MEDIVKSSRPISMDEFRRLQAIHAPPKAHPLFTKSVVISLKRRPDRLQAFYARKDRQDWPFPIPEVFEAVDGNKLPGGNVLACLQSHLQVLERAIMDDVEGLVVFEDDAVACDNLTSRLQDFLVSVPDDWDCLMLGGHCYTGELLPVAPGVLAVAGCERMHAYAIRGEFMKDFYEALVKARIGQHCDHVLMEVQRHRRVYAPAPFLFEQAPGQSDISWQALGQRGWHPPGSLVSVASLPPFVPPTPTATVAVRLFVNYFTSHDRERGQEFIRTLRSNISNPLFDKVVVLAQADPPDGIDLTKVEWVRKEYHHRTMGRPSYQDYVDEANLRVANPQDVSVIANGDMDFVKFPADLTRWDLTNKVVALSRWEERNGKLVMEVYDHSQDVWIFSGRLRPVEGIDIMGMGMHQCDNHLAWKLRHADYEVINPCLDWITIHRHNVQVHNNDGQGRWPYENVEQVTSAKAHLRKTAIRPAKGIIAFSLWGHQAKYCFGMVENARLAKHIYPGVVIRVYHDSTVSALVLEELVRLGAELVLMPDSKGSSGMFWRFQVMNDPAFDWWAVRDADSRLNYRERRAVDDWLRSGAAFHVMRDHPWHRRPIMGCAFGGLRLKAPIEIPENPGTNYGDDENWLAEKIWPMIQNVARVHTAKNWPCPRELDRFVGERFHHDEHVTHSDRYAMHAPEKCEVERPVKSSSGRRGEQFKFKGGRKYKKLGGEWVQVGSTGDKKITRMEREGPGKWAELHTRKWGEGDDLKWGEGDDLKWVMETYLNSLPCGECRNHFREFLAKYPPDVSSPESAFKWSVFIHNEVNRMLGKPVMGIQEAGALWGRQG